MKLKALSFTAISSAVLGNITKEDIFFIISIIVTVLNLIMEYLRSKKSGPDHINGDKNDNLEKSEPSP